MRSYESGRAFAESKNHWLLSPLYVRFVDVYDLMKTNPAPWHND